MKIRPSPLCVFLVDVGGHPILVLPFGDHLRDEPAPEHEDRLR